MQPPEGPWQPSYPVNPPWDLGHASDDGIDACMMPGTSKVPSVPFELVPRPPWCNDPLKAPAPQLTHHGPWDMPVMAKLMCPWHQGPVKSLVLHHPAMHQAQGQKICISQVIGKRYVDYSSIYNPGYMGNICWLYCMLYIWHISMSCFVLLYFIIFKNI